MRKIYLGFLVSLVILLGGCATYEGYYLSLNGFSNPDTPLRITPKNTFCVLENSEARNSVYEKEVKHRVEDLLKKAGFTLKPFKSADFFIILRYGMGAPQEARSSDIDPTFGLVFSPSPHIAFTGFSVTPTTWTLASHYLDMKVLDAAAYRKSREDEVVVWLGKVVSASRHPDIREVVPAMLEGAMTIFGKDTKKAVPLHLDERSEKE